MEEREKESNPKPRPKPKPSSADVAERGVPSIGVHPSGNLCVEEYLGSMHAQESQKVQMKCVCKRFTIFSMFTCLL